MIHVSCFGPSLPKNVLLLFLGGHCRRAREEERNKLASFPLFLCFHYHLNKTLSA